MKYENTRETKLKSCSSGYTQTVPQFIRFATMFLCSGVVTQYQDQDISWMIQTSYIPCVIYLYTWKTNMMYTKAWKTTWKCHSSFFNSKVSPPCSLRTKILIKNSIRRCVDRKIRMSTISFFSTLRSNTSPWTHNRCSSLQYFAPYPIDHSSFSTPNVSLPCSLRTKILIKTVSGGALAGR